MEIFLDHYWCVFELRNCTLVSQIHSDAISMTNVLSAITSKQIKFSCILTNDVISFLVVHISCSWAIFSRIFLFFARVRNYYMGTCTYNSAVPRRQLIVSLLKVRISSKVKLCIYSLFTVYIHCSLCTLFFFVSETKFVWRDTSCDQQLFLQFSTCCKKHNMVSLHSSFII